MLDGQSLKHAEHSSKIHIERGLLTKSINFKELEHLIVTDIQKRSCDFVFFDAVRLSLNDHSPRVQGN